jgi:hypothetical protein
LVPDRDLPPVQAPSPWTSDVAALSGKGMWVWEFDQTEAGNAAAIVRRAVQTGLHQLWVRVADSRTGFYGAGELAALVGPAHAAGLAVVAWGFPYLYDPVSDAGWTASVLAWHDRHGERVDGFSPDIEKSTEGVDLTAQRAGVYLGDVRRAAGNRLVVATVYSPIDVNWQGGGVPYTMMARYVDAFAPMVYWGCTEPVLAATLAWQRLSTLRPVHLIGQAYNMGPWGGRTVAPPAGEISAFLAFGRRAGALGASFWDWQSASPDEWTALSAFHWPG